MRPGVGTIADRDGEVRFPALDGLRAVAILLVVFWHYYACVPRPAAVTEIPLLEGVAAYGWTGVPLFFVLSGFLISRILIRHRGERGYYSVFFIRRATRILPLYFLCLATYAAARALCPVNGITTVLFDSNVPAWSYAVFVQNLAMARVGGLGGHWLSVTWSLAVEEQFYLLLPMIIAITRPAARFPLAFGLVAGAVAFRWFALEYHLANATAVIVLLPSRMDAFALGMLAGLLFDGGRGAGRARRWTALAATAGVALIVVARSATTAYLTTLYLLLALVFAAVLLHAVCSPRGRVAGLLSWRPLRWVGAVSYFVYLFHQPANYLVHALTRRQAPNLADGRGVLATAGALALVLGCAELSRRHFEGPLIRFGKRWRYAAGAP